ncbi:hypothetical protein D3C73_1242390 [compost metagenome]
MQHPCEAPGCRRFLRSFEEEPVGAGTAVGVFLGLNSEKQRRLALHNLFQQLRVVLQALRELRQSPGELKQELQAVRLRQCLEVVNDFRQGGGQSVRTHLFQLTHNSVQCILCAGTLRTPLCLR